MQNERVDARVSECERTNSSTCMRARDGTRSLARVPRRERRAHSRRTPRLCHRRTRRTPRRCARWTRARRARAPRPLAPRAQTLPARRARRHPRPARPARRRRRRRYRRAAPGARPPRHPHSRPPTCRRPQAPCAPPADARVAHAPPRTGVLERRIRMHARRHADGHDIPAGDRANHPRLPHRQPRQWQRQLHEPRARARRDARAT